MILFIYLFYGLVRRKGCAHNTFQGLRDCWNGGGKYLQTRDLARMLVPEWAPLKTQGPGGDVKPGDGSYPTVQLKH